MSVKPLWSSVERNYHLLWAQDGISELRETLVSDLLLLGVGRQGRREGREARCGMVGRWELYPGWRLAGVYYR